MFGDYQKREIGRQFSTLLLLLGVVWSASYLINDFDLLPLYKRYCGLPKYDDNSQTTGTVSVSPPPAPPARGAPASSTVAQSPDISFRQPTWCPRAAKDYEVMICQDPNLSAADIEMSSRYFMIKNKKSSSLIYGQNIFFKGRANCMAQSSYDYQKNCLMMVYLTWSRNINEALSVE